MDLKNPVSNRQFAKMVGRAESAVRKAKERQSILEGVTADGKLIPEIAAREWGVEILTEFGGTSAVGKTDIRPVVKRDIPPVSKKPVREKKEPVTADDYVNEMMHDPVPKVSKKEIAEFDEQEEGGISEGTSKVEAERRIAIYKAKMAELAYNEKKGTLISIDKLKVVYDYGSQMRTDLEGIPDRAIDEILANAEDRKAAKKILVEEIYDTLNRLSKSRPNL